MQVSDLVFFSISSAIILIVFCVIMALIAKDYFYDFCEDRENEILSYLGWGFLGCLLAEMCAMLLILVLGLIFGIDEYALSYLGKFMNSDLFLFIDLLCFSGLAVVLYFMAKYYSFFDVIRYRNNKSKYKGVVKASEHVERSLKDIDKQIKDAKKNGVSDRVLKELEDNRLSLSRSHEAYLIKIKHLENINVKLLSRMKENNVYYD